MKNIRSKSPEAIVHDAIFPKKPRQHFVYVDSSIGKEIGFTSENFDGVLPQKKHVKKGRHSYKIPRENINAGSRIYIDESTGRFLIYELHMKDARMFDSIDLMVNIAEKYRFAVGFVRDINMKEDKVGEPFRFVSSKERLGTDEYRIELMAAEDIIDRLTPVAQNKLRFTDNQIHKILTSSVLPYDSDMALVINVCGEFLSKSPTRITVEQLTGEELLRRYKASKLLLWSHYYALMPNFFPRNPDEGDVITKVIGKKTVGFECKNGVFEEVIEDLPVAE